MKLMRLSLYYLAGYTVPSGALLLLAPDVALRLLQSNGAYGDVMPRLAGGAIFALGLLITQIIRHKVEVLYTTTLGIRVVLLAALGWLYARSADPFFIIVGAIVAVGMTLTFSAYLLDTKSSRLATARG